jgi:GDSL-like lipase/acylhydrolase family protein
MPRALPFAILLAVAIVLGAGAGSAGAGSVTNPPCAGGSDPNHNVVAIGDSITLQLTDALHYDFAAHSTPISVNGHCSYRIDQLRPFLQIYAASLPNLRDVFFFGGTNDAWKYQNDSTWKLSWTINELHAAVHDIHDKRPKACVFLVTVRDFDYNTPRYHQAVSAINPEIKSIAANTTRTYVIDWASVAARHPDYFASGFNGLIGHVNDKGAAALAAMYLSAEQAHASTCTGPLPPGVS